MAAWIDEYNTARCHSALQMTSALAWELAHLEHQQEAA
ncbi:transposase InsO family protein [Arthrobacter sp. UYCo732]